jgi:hypothetical protein
MANIYVYSARRLPLSDHELEHIETRGATGVGDGGGGGSFTAESGTYCCVVCGPHTARTALAWNRRR